MNNQEINKLQEEQFNQFLRELPLLSDTFDTDVMRLVHAKGVTLGIEIATALMQEQAE